MWAYEAEINAQGGWVGSVNFSCVNVDAMSFFFYHIWSGTSAQTLKLMLFVCENWVYRTSFDWDKIKALVCTGD